MSSRESYEAAQHGWEQAVGVQLRRAEVAEAEARALRAALEQIAKHRCFGTIAAKGACRQVFADLPERWCPPCVANEALKEPGHGSL